MYVRKANFTPFSVATDDRKYVMFGVFEIRHSDLPATRIDKERWQPHREDQRGRKCAHE